MALKQIELKERGVPIKPKKKLIRKIARAEIDYLRPKLPYECDVYFAHLKDAPDEDKSIPMAVTILDVNESAITLDTGKGNRVMPYTSIAKICPRGSTL